jgi:hypothetical protein
MLPSEVRLKAQAVREAAQRRVKKSQQARDKSDVPMREAEAVLFKSQRACEKPCRGGQPPSHASVLLSASHAARCVTYHGVRFHPVPVALVGECSISLV